MTSDAAARHQYDIQANLPACPDTEPAGNWELSAKLWEGRFENGRPVDHRVRAYPSRASLEGQVRALREAEPTLVSMNFGGKRRVKMRESEMDWWGYGLSTNPSLLGRGPNSSYIPLLPGPATRQLYWADYFAMSAKAFEAYQHNPLAHRAIEIGTEFVIGRGVESVAKTDRGQKVWDAYWQYNRMDGRLEEILGDVASYGEVMLRYFPMPGRQLAVRSLDPAGIYEIVTDQEDWESVFFYHQQEQERAQLFAPPAGDIAPQGPTTPDAVTKYTIRQIPAAEIDHYRLNVRSGEVRGRSDLFPALGYLKRLQDLLTSKVIRSDMEARMVYDLMVKGNANDVTNVKGSLFPGNRPPEPGTILAHNDQVELNLAGFQGAGAHGEDTTVEEIVEMVANGVGVSRQYIWTASKGGSARAGALIATEPGQKRFERRQRLAQRMLQDMAARVFALNGCTGEDADIEFIFPAIAVEERSAALKDIAFAESMGWISKTTAATMGARQLDMETFDFEDEQEKIAEEFEQAADEDEEATDPVTDPTTGAVVEPGKPAKPKQGDGVIRRPMVAADFRQAPKLDPTKAVVGEDDPPGLLMGVPEGGGGVGSANPRAPGRAGIPGDENPSNAAGAANIRQDSKGGALRESETERIAKFAIREAHAAAKRAPRRKPEDDDFQEASATFAAGAERNAADLLAAVHPAVEPKKGDE